MPDNLESFVKKLKSEGVDAGKEAAEQLKREAEEEAGKIISRAREEANAIIDEAKEDAAKRHRNTESELKMAVRDAILRLRESLTRALTGVITHNAGEVLEDPDYLREIIKDVVLTYAKADATPGQKVEIEVSEAAPDGWMQHIIEDLAESLQTSEDDIQIQASLARVGFDYRVEGATVEISPDSVAELLLEMVTPRLQELIRQAMKGAPDESSEKGRDDAQYGVKNDR